MDLHGEHKEADVGRHIGVLYLHVCTQTKGMDDTLDVASLEQTPQNPE